MSELKERIAEYVANEKAYGESREQIEADLAYYVDEALESSFPKEVKP